MEKKQPTAEMSSDEIAHADSEAQQRIAELEQQVARLEGKLQGQVDHASASGHLSSPMISVSRFKIIVVGVITSIIILSLILTLFSFLSKGFDAAARRAAEAISPHPESQVESQIEPGSSSHKAEQDADDVLVRPPGL